MADTLSYLLINGDDAYEKYGIRMGDDFIDSLNAFPAMKDYVENASRLYDGKTILVGEPKVSSNDITLTFLLEGTSQDDFKAKKTAFIEVLKKGNVTIQVPRDSDNIYRLVYTKGTSYAQNTQRTFCKVACKFTEPDPTNRGTTDKNATTEG